MTGSCDCPPPQLASMKQGIGAHALLKSVCSQTQNRDLSCCCCCCCSATRVQTTRVTTSRAAQYSNSPLLSSSRPLVVSTAAAPRLSQLSPQRSSSRQGTAHTCFDTVKGKETHTGFERRVAQQRRQHSATQSTDKAQHGTAYTVSMCLQCTNARHTNLPKRPHQLPLCVCETMHSRVLSITNLVALVPISHIVRL